uniref:Uncharacterized protein n=1 Tax=Anguilla anguilla TaxID=7936 RepID=A0A0E9VMG6_ANGAN
MTVHIKHYGSRAINLKHLAKTPYA